jgi:hypothetical protein
MKMNIKEMNIKLEAFERHLILRMSMQEKEISRLKIKISKMENRIRNLEGEKNEKSE